jgi:ribosomal protein L37AE/L43A
MKIKEIVSQFRRDFTAVYVCEGCGNEKKQGGGYDDRNYHDNVIPEMKCDKCGKSTKDLGITPEYRETKYKQWEVV